jgi:acyl-CoA thioester hydrolase
VGGPGLKSETWATPINFVRRPPLPGTSCRPVSQTRIRVRYAETDQMGVVYYANFFIWFEIGRVELLRQLGFQYKEMETDDDCHIPVVEATCRYKSPARYDDELLLETTVLALRRTVIKFGYRLFRTENEAQTLLAEGETTHVTVNRSMRKVRLPQKYVAVLEQFLV